MNVLITCGNSPIMSEVIPLVSGITAVKSIILVDAEEIDFLHGAKKSYLVPNGNSKDYIDSLSVIVNNEAIDKILVGSDDEAMAISQVEWLRSKSHIDKPENIRLILNKFDLHDKLSEFENGKVLLPRYMKLTDKESLTKFITSFGSAIIRPVSGRGSRGLSHVVPSNALNQFPKAISIDEYSCQESGDFFITEYLPGDKYSADCIFDDGQLCTIMIRNNGSQVKYKPPTMNAAPLADAAVYDFAQTIGRALCLNGFHQIECGLDSLGNPRLIEINPRLDATLPITVCYSENFYELIISNETKGMLIPKRTVFKRYFKTFTI